MIACPVLSALGHKRTYSGRRSDLRYLEMEAAVRGRTILTSMNSPGFINLDRDAMLLDDDVVTYGKAKSGALASGLRREERIEDPLLYLGRNAGAVVANLISTR
jgi:hypothetical protein